MKFPTMKLAALAGIFLAACGGQPARSQASASQPSQSAQALTKVVVAYPNVRSAHSPLWVAKEAGIFEQNGIDADLRKSPPNAAIASLIAGDVQFCSCSGTALVNAAAAGADLVTLAVLLPIEDVELQAAPGIKTAADLKGKKVGIPGIGTAGAAAVGRALQHLGLDPKKDVTLVVVGSTSSPIPALVNGAIQAATTSPPDSIVLESRGYNTLLSAADLKQTAAGAAVVVQRAYLNSHRELAQKYVDSLMQATVKAQRDKAFTTGVLEKYQKTADGHVLDATYDFYFGQQPLISSLPYPTTEELGPSVDALAATNPKARSLDLNSLIDSSFVKNAAGRGLDH